MSLSLAIGLWYVFIPGSKILEVTYQVPVRIEHLPQEMVLEKIDPPNVSVTFGALNRAFYLFEPQKLEAKVDASLAVLGRRTFQISAEDLNYPKNLTVKELTPDTIKISVKSNGKKGT